MYANLEQQRKIKNVTLVDIADLLGIKYQTVREKIDGKSSFKFEEAEKIKKISSQNTKLSTYFLKTT